MGGESDDWTFEDEDSLRSTASSKTVSVSMMPQERPPLPSDLKSRSLDDENRWGRTYSQLLGQYQEGLSQVKETCADALRDSMNDVLRYKPGQWMRTSGSVPRCKLDIPSTTTLLLVGPRGSGKSSLVNRISRLFEHGVYSDRAQVSHNLSAAKGTCFLQEYLIPRDSGSFCLYDTRSLSDDPSDNLVLLKKWMTQGVRDGEMVLRKSDSLSTRTSIKSMVRHGYLVGQRKRVDSVIVVVNGKSILNSMNNKNKAYMDIFAETFNYPFLSFGDNKPAVVVTHGDELSSHERALVCAYLGELLGIPPGKQIFDIPMAAVFEKDCTDTMIDSVIVKMMHYSLEQADRNFAVKQNIFQKVENTVSTMIDELRDLNTVDIFWQLVIVWIFILLILRV